MEELFDCAGNELLSGDPVMYRFRAGKDLRQDSPFGYGWVVRSRGNQVLVSGASFLLTNHLPRMAYRTGGRWMNPNNLRRMPPRFFQSLPPGIWQTLRDIYQEQIL